ncbi:pilus assembly protein PilM [bacterium]|nr:pilus assembly protein PilM [bacterium]
MALSCGLEVGPKTLKLAVLEGNARSVELLDFVVKKLELKKGESPEQVAAKVLKEVLAQKKVPLTNVVASVRAQDAILREIAVPFLRDEQIKKTIRFQAETHFHAVSVDDLIVQYLKFAETEKQSRLLVAGVKKAHIERKLRFLEEGGIDPVAIDLDLAALYNCLGHAGVYEKRALVLCVEIEHDTLKVALVDEGKLRLARAIRIRTGEIKAKGESGRLSKQSDRLAKAGGEKETPGEGGFVGEIGAMIGDAPETDEKGVPKLGAEDEDDEAFNLEDSTVSPAQREDYLARVFLEIDRTIGAVALKKPIDLIALTGASCAFEGIDAFFKEHYETAVERVDLTGRYGTAGAKKGDATLSLQGPTAIGLALKGLGIDAAGLDFRQDEYRFRGKYEMLKKGAMCALSLVFVLTFVFAFGLKQKLKERRRTLEGVRRLQEMTYGVLFPDLSANANADHKQEPIAGRWYESLAFERQRLEGIYGGGAGGLAGGNTSALVVLREFGEAKKMIGREWGIDVTTVRVDPREGQQSLFVFSSPTDAAGIQLQKAFEDKKGPCEGSTQSSHVEKGKCRTEFVVKLKKTAPEGS